MEEVKTSTELYAKIQKVIDEIGRAADSINGDYMTIPDVIKTAIDSQIIQRKELI